MKVIKINFLKIISSLIILVILLPLVELKLKCEPDHKSIGDNYNCLPDPDDDSEYFYSYEFAHKAGEKEYYDHWKGVYWDAEKFCYDAYDNTTREDGLVYSGFSDIKVFSEEDDSPRPDEYVNISQSETNLVNLHKQVCKTKQHTLSDYNHGEYELLLKMDSYFGDDDDKKYYETPHHFYFTIENPSNENITFALKVRNFINTTEEMYANVSDWIINEECVTTTPIAPPTEPEPESDPDPEPEPEPDPPVFTSATTNTAIPPDSYSDSYGPQNVLYDDPSHAWNADYSVGAWIQLSADSEQTVHGFTIINGYSKSEDVYNKNHRPRDITIELSDGYAQTATLEDLYRQEQRIKFDGVHQTTYLRITVNSSYGGWKYDDCCIDRIEAF